MRTFPCCDITYAFSKEKHLKILEGVHIGYLLRGVAAALFFSSYPIFIKRSGLNWWVSALLMNAFGFLVSFAVAAVIYMIRREAPLSQFIFREGEIKAGYPPVMLMALLIGAYTGVVNGLGHCFYHQIIATPIKDLFKLSIVVPVAGIALGVCIAVTFNGERLTANRVLALCSAALTIWFAARR